VSHFDRIVVPVNGSGLPLTTSLPKPALPSSRIMAPRIDSHTLEILQHILIVDHPNSWYKESHDYPVHKKAWSAHVRQRLPLEDYPM